MSDYRVVIYNSKGELWDSEKHETEQVARESAVRWSTNNPSCRVVVRRVGVDLANYRNGKEYKPRARKEAKP